MGCSDNALPIIQGDETHESCTCLNFAIFNGMDLKRITQHNLFRNFRAEISFTASWSGRRVEI